MTEELSDGTEDPSEPGLGHSMLPGYLEGPGSWALLTLSDYKSPL